MREDCRWACSEGGAAQAGFSANLAQRLAGAGINAPEITDNRNAPGQGQFYPVSNQNLNARINEPITTITYSPQSEVVECFTDINLRPQHQTLSAVTVKKVQ